MAKRSMTLRESNEAFKIIVDTSPYGIYQVDSSGKFIFVNESFATMFGYRREELPGKHFADMLSADALPKVERMVQKVLSGKDVRDKVTVKHKDGHEIPVNFGATPLREQGKIIGLTGVLSDITKRKQAEKVLRVREELFQALIENSSDAISILNADGTLRYESPSMPRILGYERGKTIGKTSFEVIHPDDIPNVTDSLAQLLQNPGGTVQLEARVLHKDGSWHTLEIVAINHLENPVIAGIVVNQHDITKRKQAEEALRESEAKWRSLVENAPETILTLDRDGTILFINHTLPGYTPEELTGTSIFSYIAADGQKRLRKVIESVFQSGEFQKYEADMTSRDGRQVWFECSVAPIWSGDQVVSVIYISVDITERKRMEHALRESHDELEKRVKERTAELEKANKSLQAEIKERKQIEQTLRESEYNYRVLFESAIDGTAVVDAETMKIVLVNDTALKMYGFDSPEKALEANLLDYIHTDDRERILGVIAEDMFEKDLRRVEEFRTITKDGRERWVSAVGTRIEYQGKLAGLASFRDITEQKQAEEALRESENRYRELADLLPQIVIEFDTEGNFTFVNRKGFLSTGYSQDDFGKGINIFQLLVPEDLERGKDNLQRMFSGEESTGTEYTALRKDGTTFPIIIYSSPIIRDNQPVGIRAVAIDITERKQAEEKLRISERKFKDLTETTPDLVWETDENGVYSYVSPNVEQLLGYKVNEVLGKTPFDLMPKEEAKKNSKIFKELVTKRNPIHGLENINRHRDGHLVVLETNGIPFFDEKGKLKGYRGIDRDITERKHADKSLREREEHFRALIDNSLEAIAIIDGEGAIQYLGPSFEHLMGYELEEYLGKNPFDHVHSDDRSRVAAIFAELTQKPGSIVQEEVRVLHKNGSLRTVEVVGQNLLHNPAVGGIVVNMRDITERKQAAEKLQALYQQEKDLRERIESEMKRRVEFTRVLAHELKTPLTSVLASSDLLISEIRDEPLLSLAKNIGQGASSLNSRIDELLDLAKGEIGMLHLKREPVDLSHLLREAADSITPLALGRGQSIILRLPPALPTVQADTTRLQQIVTNLLNNAVKFTPKGGSITLRARKKDASVIVEVQDTGRGIPKREQERLFEPYQRLEEDEENLSGLGLGLSLCKTLVELHGGQIWVRSHVGRGSTFGFSLPLEVADKQATEPEKIAKLWKVLIIEDNQQIVDSVSLTFRLRWPEAQLISTGLGEEGIEMVETEAPDIVILDLGLPDISGFDALRQIRLFSSVPVVILTVREDESDMVKGLEWGADDYLVKPFKQLELLARLKVQLRKQTPPGEEAPIVCGPLRLEPSTSQLTHDGKEISLTIIEGRIIECLMRNAGHVVTHSRLAETVWGEDYPGALASLRVYIRYLREKLEANPSKPKIILTKASVGYSLAKRV